MRSMDRTAYRSPQIRPRDQRRSPLGAVSLKEVCAPFMPSGMRIMRTRAAYLGRSSRRRLVVLGQFRSLVTGLAVLGVGPQRLIEWLMVIPMPGRSLRVTSGRVVVGAGLLRAVVAAGWALPPPVLGGLSRAGP